MSKASAIKTAKAKESIKIKFMQQRFVALALSLTLIVASAFLLFQQSLNFGIDFTGGIVVELRAEDSVDLASIRTPLSLAIEGEVALQHFGSTQDVMIRVEQSENDSDATAATVASIKSVVDGALDGIVDYRKVDYVGPQVGKELVEAGAIALLAALGAILLYIWIRFEWQFGMGAIIALFHDVVLTLGLYSFLGLEFNLTSIAAILTIIGYSINDSVVIYDRVRDNLRKFKKMPLIDVLDKSLNETLSRTLITAITTMVALLALVILGGEIVRGFSIAVLFGVMVGTYSSIYIAAPILTYTSLKNRHSAESD